MGWLGWLGWLGWVGVVTVVEMVRVVIVVDLVSKRLHKRFQSWWLGRFGTEEAKRPKKKKRVEPTSRPCRKRLVKTFLLRFKHYYSFWW